LRAGDVELYGTLYRPVADVAAQYGMTTTWVTPNKVLQLKNKYCTIELTANERSLRLNDEPMSLGSPIVFAKGTLYIARLDFECNLLPLLAPALLPHVPALHRIIIDPGHGGADSGTVNASLNTNEKTNTLDVALRLATELKKRGYDVLMIRTTDITVDRHLRAAMANQAKGDLYISIHFNQADDSAVAGVETWILPPPGGQESTEAKPTADDKQTMPGNRFDSWNAILGFSVERTVAGKLQTLNRGIKRRRLDVLAPLDMPGLLVECGFLSNPVEGAKIKTTAYRQSIAEALADGIDLYKATLDSLAPKPASAPPAQSNAPIELKPTSGTSHQ
jgi:N-acetylmuramoyl-L-alanine amidase